jgi:hypothetical protein
MAGPDSGFTWILSESAAQAITFQGSGGVINETVYNAMIGAIGTVPQVPHSFLLSSFYHLYQSSLWFDLIWFDLIWTLTLCWKGGTGEEYQRFLDLWASANTTLYPGAGNRNPEVLSINSFNRLINQSHKHTHMCRYKRVKRFKRMYWLKCWGVVFHFSYMCPSLGMR